MFDQILKKMFGIKESFVDHSTDQSHPPAKLPRHPRGAEVIKIGRKRFTIQPFNSGGGHKRAYYYTQSINLPQ